MLIGTTSSCCYAYVPPTVGLRRAYIYNRREESENIFQFSAIKLSAKVWRIDPQQRLSIFSDFINQRFRTGPLRMCICIHCAHVTNCSAYHFVEEKHDQPHMTENPTFTPLDGSPTIHVNIRTSTSKDPVARIWAEHSEQQGIAERRAAEKGTDVNEERGEKVYDLSTRTTYEYDVVKCESYVHDQDCWVRNMPEAIKLANPRFIPS